jgi:DNA-directed RNA polymerase subunit H (RpoH/RPB5)
MDHETLDTLFHSRRTLLNILAARGYDTKPYEKFGPFEIGAMAAAGNSAFRMDLERPADKADNGKVKCRVDFVPRMKNRLAGIISNYIQDEEEKPDAIDSDTTELIFLTTDPIVDAFHSLAFKCFATNLRVSFFQIDTLVNNPLDHMLVPKHEKVPTDQHAELMKRLRVNSKTMLPLIRFHEDIIGRIMSLVPGDIVKITRPSPSAGEYVSYRVCAP